MPLVLSRLRSESIFLFLESDADHDLLLKKLATSEVEIRIGEIKGEHVRICIDAPDDISIFRGELLSFN